ncbi:addB [Acrasis kona]|uniref:AddB n=1 Tax=Acrasis kona TaxID=1008807 RepID=A0AAW2YIT2_9EUKA
MHQSDLCLDKIELMFKNKLISDKEIRREVEDFAKLEWYEHYLTLFDKIQIFNDMPDLHSKKRSIVVEMYKTFVDEQSEKYILIQDDWRSYIEQVAVKLLQDEKSTTKQENNTIVAMLENIVVKRLITLFTNCCLKSRRVHHERRATQAKPSTWTNLLASFGRKSNNTK